MADFTFITARLATGGAITSQADVDALAAAGISSIIDCRDDFDDAALLSSRPSMAYLWNGAADDGKQKPATWFQKSIEFALPALAQPHKKVYCHCQAGINRGPSTAYAILRALGFGRDEMLTLIRLKRPQTIVGIRYSADADAAIQSLGYGP
jgi:protein tyrosine phosphatase (PTP) superfamily phosphohydrolase (DUF442 family)